MSKKSLITQDNALINASYTLDLVEKRLILLAIAKSRKTGSSITSNYALEIHANDYAESFGVERQASYMALKSASENLFDRYFTYEVINKSGNLETHKSRWTSDIAYIANESSVKIIFSPAVVPLITDLEQKFTSYFLDDISGLTSIYAIRLYELIIAWKSTHQTPILKIEDIRNKLGLSKNQYLAMCDFKKRVLDVAINQINNLSNIKIEVEQHKKGRSIIGFSFNFVEIKLNEANESENVSHMADIKTITSQMMNAKPVRKQRKVITKQEAESLARVGESWDDLLNRIKNDYFVKFEKT